MDLIQEGLAHLAAEGEVDPERAVVDVVSDYEMLFERAGRLCELAGGVPLTGEAARRLACDAGLVRIIVRGRSEVLDVGRKTRQWNRPQRRAIRARHGDRCAILGCDRRILQIHHTTWWSDGGVTAIDVGVPLCGGHHWLVHEGGWDVAYDPATGITTLSGPDGQQLRTVAHLRIRLPPPRGAVRQRYEDGGARTTRRQGSYTQRTSGQGRPLEDSWSSWRRSVAASAARMAGPAQRQSGIG